MKQPDFKNDIVTLSQGDRGILEFQYKIPDISRTCNRIYRPRMDGIF